ncbi:hypothetical protein Tco_0509156 [Tanacetum coccineum]
MMLLWVVPFSNAGLSEGVGSSVRNVGRAPYNCSIGVATSINNAGVANASSLGGHTLEADDAGAYGSAIG